MEVKKWLKDLEGLGIVVSNIQIQQFLAYKDHIQKVNQVLNLTAIDDDEGILYKHFYDCLLISEFIKEGALVADVGSGAGFPGMVLAIARPDIKVVCIEPTQKRTNFLKEVVELTNLNNVTILNKRAEDIMGAYRESFDVVTARAVAYLDILAELCLPFVKVGGVFIAMKGSRIYEELDISQKALDILGGGSGIIHEQFHELIGPRYNLEITKKVKSPHIYPRSYAKIKKTPLSGRKHE